MQFQHWYDLHLSPIWIAGEEPNIRLFRKGSEMAVHSTNAPSFAGDIGAAIAAFFTNMIENSSMARAAEVRGAQIDALNAKTDTELTVMGERRDEIPAYVFRDLVYI